MNGYWEHVCDYPYASNYSFECYQHLPQLHTTLASFAEGCLVSLIFVCVVGSIIGWFQKDQFKLTDDEIDQMVKRMMARAKCDAEVKEINDWANAEKRRDNS